MDWKRSEKVKFSTYLTKETARAVKQLARKKSVSVAYVIEFALKKQIPARYYDEVK